MYKLLSVLGLSFCLQGAFAQTPAPGGASTGATGSISMIEPRVRDETDAKQFVTRVHLAPHFSTTIRMRDPVRSVVVGDPSKFWADHNDNDPSLVIVHARTEQAAQTNLEITTVTGQQAVLWLLSDPESHAPIDFALHYDKASGVAGSFWRNESSTPQMLVAETVPVNGFASAVKPESATVSRPSIVPVNYTTTDAVSSSPDDDDRLVRLLAQQGSAPLPPLYGQHPGPIKAVARVRAGVSQVIDEGSMVVVLFSAVNPGLQAIALLPPQIQLGGQVKKKWTTAEQLPVIEYKLDRLRLGPGERANGVVAFERPSFKQSKESLFLQLAESGAIDQPALAPIGFGVSTDKGGTAYAGFSRK
jgi:hypothetical protein